MSREGALSLSAGKSSDILHFVHDVLGGGQGGRRRSGTGGGVEKGDGIGEEKQKGEGIGKGREGGGSEIEMCRMQYLWPPIPLWLN